MMLIRSTGGFPANPVMSFAMSSFRTLMASSKLRRSPPIASGTAVGSMVPGMHISGVCPLGNATPVVDQIASPEASSGKTPFRRISMKNEEPTDCGLTRLRASPEKISTLSMTKKVLSVENLLAGLLNFRIRTQ